MFKRLFGLSFCVFVLCTGGLSARSLHAILIATLDKDISDSAFVDIHEWHRQLGEISAHARLDYKPVILASANPQEVLDYIKEFQVESSDVIFFYYAGHGFRALIDTSNWPNMQFGKRGISGEEVVSHIRQKGAQLNLIFFDCCNSIYPYWRLPEICHFGAPEAFSQAVHRGRSRLFSEAVGTYVMTASEPGLDTKGSHTRGGDFTRTLLEAMNCRAARGKSWEDVLEWTKRILKRQRPVYEIYR